MRLITGKRVGQSSQELTLAVLFSFFLHALILFASLFLYLRTDLAVYEPSFYDVTLVEPSAELLKTITPVPPVSPPEKKPVKKVVPAKESMPELGKEKKPAKVKEEEEAEPREEAAEPREAVAVTSPEDFKFPPYLAIVRDKIVRNWNPPPGAKETKARVVFKIYRSGVVSDADFAEASGNFYFDQAAMRAILASSPFPPLPEGFYKEYGVFSVDLMERE